MLPPVIVVTGHGDVPTAVRAMKNGAFDFIEKPYAVRALLNTIDRAIEWDAEMRRHRAETAADTARVRLLTPREREVLQLLAIGCSLKEAALRLRRSVNTLNRHTSNLMRKLGIHSRVKLVHLAIRAGLVDLSAAEPSIPHPLGVCQCGPQAGASW
jgi:two-component system response regulator FixJ